MIRLSYISDLPLRSGGGGSYAVNWHVADQLKRHFDIDFRGEISPRPSRVTGLVSQIRRKVLRLPGSFAYFSPSTLKTNAARVRAQVPENSDAVFFRAAARWSRCQPDKPYFVSLDAVFHTFFHNTFRAEDFDAADLRRIWDEEAAFLERAAGVFFESRWGLERAREAYDLRGTHFHAPGRGGVIEPPARDTWICRPDAPLKLVTVAKHFRQKGGDFVMEAYKRLKPSFPELTWHVVGGAPEGDWQSVDGIVHEGYLNPQDPMERERFFDLMADAFLLLHPTREDTSPLVITEAAYFGCPSVSVRRFAIPDLIDHGKTGVLLDRAEDVTGLVEAVSHLIRDRDRYLDMRREARQVALGTSTWPAVGDIMAGVIREACGIV